MTKTDDLHHTTIDVTLRVPQGLSLGREDVREAVAVALFLRGKASHRQAAFLAETDRRGFDEALAAHGVPPSDGVDPSEEVSLSLEAFPTDRP